VTPGPPAGTVTFLCCAVDGSTRGPHELPESVVRELLAEHGGHLYAASDTFAAAAFATAADAAEAAVALQRRLLDRPAPTAGVGIGIHTGEAVEGERAYAGPEAERAQRLASLAHGGQIVVSDTAGPLLGARLTLQPLGEHRLGDLGRRMTVYQLDAEGLPADFGGLRRPDRQIGNVPDQQTSFVGRDEQLIEVGERVLAHSLVTLGGVGGVGKTRLALETAAGLAGEFPDGVWLIDLAAVSEPSSVLPTIATTLGIAPRGDTDLADTVEAAMAGRRALLVMDNCEHVRSAASTAVRTVLSTSQTVRVLATSREYLGVDGEQRVDVAPLGLVGDAGSDAVRLFVERARAVRPDFGIQDAHAADAVIDICRTLDGLPLGVELAAARMAAMSPREVRDRLDARFRLLRGRDDRPARQQTLVSAVGWSYDLLEADEQRLLRTASVFSGGFDVQSLAAVAGDDEVDVLAKLDSLVGKSLAVADHSAGATRYRLYETIRQFAEDRLAESGERETVRGRHASHVAGEAVVRWSEWNGPGWRESVDWVELELGNLRSAFRWSAHGGHVATAADIAAHAALMGFSIELFEPVSWAEELVDAATAADVARLPRLLTAAGYACFVGRAEAAAAHAGRAVELEQLPGYDGCEPGYATFVEALGHVYSGRLDRYVELTRSVAERFGERRGYGLASYVDGLQASGRVDEALELVPPSVDAARRLGNPYWIAYALWIAGLALAKVDRARALVTWDEAVEHVREHDVGFFDGFLARDAARLHTSDGDAGRALDLFDTAVAAAHRAGNVAQLVITLASVPALFDRLDRVDAAATLFGALTREPAAFHHVPELAELGDRLTGRLGPERDGELRAAGAEMALGEAAGWTRAELAAARATLDRPGSSGRPGGLSPREIDVLKLIAEGRTTGEIAGQLFISAKTADHHIQHIYTKLGVSNRAAATRWAMQRGVVSTETGA
jgi:predicted ATPase/DNA-binding CsgD family transcriptional regulator